ncbi:MAG: glycosyltransferase family 4 protein [Acidimicrobiales bacterium]
MRSVRRVDEAEPLDDGPSFLIVTQYFAPERGAAQVRLAAIADELTKLGHRVEVVTAIPNYPTGRLFDGWRRRVIQEQVEDGRRVIRLWVWAAVGSGIGRWVNHLSFALLAPLGLRAARRADWVFVEYPALPAAVPVLWWCRLRGHKVVVNVADLWVDAAIDAGVIPGKVAASLAQRIERWTLRRADVVNAVTQGVADALVAKGVEPDRIRWLPNGVDPDVFCPGPVADGVREELGVPEGHDIVLYAGTHGYVHQLDVVLDAAAELVDLPVTIVMVGDGSERERLLRRAAALGLANVRLIPSVSPERVADYLQAAAVGLAAVRPGAVYESVRSAKMLPVLASETPIVYAAADEGAAIVDRIGAGIRTPPGDAVRMAEAIRTLLADPALRASMGARGRAYALAEGDWSTLVATWVASLPAEG